MNDTLRLIDQRMSLRRYASRPIAPEHVEAILHSALRAPTAANMMLYSIVQVEDQAKKDRLAETCGHAFIAQAPLVLLFLADMQRWYDYYESSGVPQFCEAQGLPYQTPQASNLMMSCCDALIAAQTTVIAAESLGIGSCYIGDILGHCEAHRALFHLPRWTLPITLVCYGYYPEQMERKRSTRFDQRYVCFKDTYKRLSKDEFQDMLAHIEAKFQWLLEQKGLNLGQLTYQNWTQGKAELEEMRSVAILLADWLGGESGADHCNADLAKGSR